MSKIFTTEIDIRTIKNEPLRSDLEFAFGRNNILYVDFEIDKCDLFPPEPEIGIFRSRYEPLSVNVVSILNQSVDSSYEVISETYYEMGPLSSFVRKHIEELCLEDAQDNDWAAQAAIHYESVQAEHRMEAAREREMD